MATATPRLTAAGVCPLPTTPVEQAKRIAARQAIDEWVTDGMVLGVGSGSTILYAIQRLVEKVHDEKSLKNICCVPTSFQSRNLIIDTGLHLSDLSQTPAIDVAIDGADEVDTDLNCIKGGGACQTQEKLVAAAAKHFVIIADSRKQAPKGLLTVWRKGVPLEVLSIAYVPVSKKLETLGGVPKLRMAVQKAGPVVTDNGNFVIDVDFGDGSQGLPVHSSTSTESSSSTLLSPSKLHEVMKLIPGVVETGIFPSMAIKAYFGMEDGTVQVWTPPPAGKARTNSSSIGAGNQ